MYKPFLTILAIHKQGGPDMAQEVLFAYPYPRTQALKW